MLFLLNKTLLADLNLKNNISMNILLLVKNCNSVYRGEHIVSPDRYTAALKTILGGGNQHKDNTLILRVSDKPSADDRMERL